MSKVYIVADQTYGVPEAILMRDNLIELRNSAIENNQAEWAITLTHTIGFLAAVIDEMRAQ